MQADVDSNGRSGGPTFTEEEEEEFLAMSRRENLYEEFARSIAPSIYGSLGHYLVLTFFLFS